MKEFRLDIQGLRALAVISVILFHTKINLFNGGYIGVDIFFVISGYLITKIIFYDIKQNTFSLFSFYHRRARRILPALIITILLVLIFSFFFTLDSGFKFIGNSVIASLFFFSNILFWSKSIDYYGLDGEFNPLVHTWSLALEEQFYLFFPLLFIFFNKKYLTKIIFCIIILSLLFAQFGGNLNFKYPYYEKNLYFWNPSYYGTFFSPVGRIWELLFGGLILLINEKYNIKKNSFVALISFLIIILSIILLNNNSQIPSILLIPPVVATGLLILFNDNNNNKTILNKLLTSNIFKFIGDISYSLYLIHLPIFVFYRYIAFDNYNLYGIIVCIILSILISFLIWKYIEQPFRKKNKVSNKFFINFIISSIFLLTFTGFMIKNNVIKSYNFDTMKKLYPNIYGNLNELYQTEILEYKKNIIKNKTFSNNDKTKKILIIGNSYSHNLFRALEQNKNLFPNLEFNNYQLKLRNLGEYYNSSDEYVEFYNSKKFKKADIIIISNRYKFLQPKTSRGDIAAIKNLLKISKQNNKKLIITGNSAIFFGAGDNALKFIINRNKHKFIKNNNLIFEEETKIEKFNLLYKVDKNSEKIIKQLAKDLNLTYLDKLKYVCNKDNNTCETVTPKGTIIFFDYSHTTMEGAKYLGEKIAKMNWLKF